MIDVLAVGETMAVVAPTTAEPLETASVFSVATAGAESNLAQWLADWGHTAAWASRVGDDPLGRRVTQALAKNGVDISYVALDPAAPTGVMFKNPDAESTTVHYVAVSFDVNYRPGLWSVESAAEVLLNYARQATYTFVGLDEAQTLWPGLGTARDVRDLIGDSGMLIVKDGAVGATEFDGIASAFVPASVVEVVEVVGAGDAFAAGWLSAMLEGEQAPNRLARGHQFAARALSSTSDFQALKKEAADID